MNPIDKLAQEAESAAKAAKAAMDALRAAKADARYTALEAVRKATAEDGARWIRSALDGVIAGRKEAGTVDYFIGKARYHWAAKGRKAPEARIVDGKPVVVYVYTERPAPTDSELAETWNRASESSRLSIYAAAKALSAFAHPDLEGPVKALIVKGAAK